MTDAKVTIGIPFYRDAKTLGDAIRSVFCQTYTQWRLILVDDGSSDGSLQIARSVQDPRVEVISDGANRGLVARLNQIVALTGTPFIARMDADDLMHPERIEKQIRFLELHPDVDLVDTAMCSMDLGGTPQGVRGLSALDPSFAATVSRGLLHHATVMGKSEWFKKNPYDPEFIRAEDWELWCRTCRTSKFARIPEPLYFVREGRVAIKPYLISCRTVRKIARRYGPEAVGRVGVLKLLMNSHLKSLAYRFFGALSAQDLLSRKRNLELSPETIAAVQTTLKSIQTTRVQGLAG